MRIPLVLLLACLLGSCGGGHPVPPASRAATTVAPRFADTDPHDWVGVMPWHYAVHGIDVSKYQGDIDWPRVRASGVAFAFIKATEGGDHADDRFADNWAAARAAGMPRGAYHYYYFCRPALEQAAWFMNHVPKDPTALPPVLDLEWTHKSRTCTFRPDPGTVRAEALKFLQALTIYYRKRPVIYTTVDFYEDNELWRLPEVLVPVAFYGLLALFFWTLVEARVRSVRKLVSEQRVLREKRAEEAAQSRPSFMPPANASAAATVAAIASGEHGEVEAVVEQAVEQASATSEPNASEPSANDPDANGRAWAPARPTWTPPPRRAASTTWARVGSIPTTKPAPRATAAPGRRRRAAGWTSRSRSARPGRGTRPPPPRATPGRGRRRRRPGRRRRR